MIQEIYAILLFGVLSGGLISFTIHNDRKSYKKYFQK